MLLRYIRLCQPPLPRLRCVKRLRRTLIAKRTLDDKDNEEPTAKRRCTDKSKEVIEKTPEKAEPVNTIAYTGGCISGEPRESSPENDDAQISDNAEKTALQEEFDAYLAHQLQEEEIESVEQQEMEEINDGRAREITAHRQEVFQNMHHHFDEQQL